MTLCIWSDTRDTNYIWKPKQTFTGFNIGLNVDYDLQNITWELVYCLTICWNYKPNHQQYTSLVTLNMTALVLQCYSERCTYIISNYYNKDWLENIWHIWDRYPKQLLVLVTHTIFCKLLSTICKKLSYVCNWSDKVKVLHEVSIPKLLLLVESWKNVKNLFFCVVNCCKKWDMFGVYRTKSGY